MYVHVSVSVNLFLRVVDDEN